MARKNVNMLCMTTKKSFEIDNPPVVVLANGRYAYCAPCPWTGKNEKQLYAYKFCSVNDYNDYVASQNSEGQGEDGKENVPSHD